ncbi:unnamed protein product [Arctia plantaginis]|uniref:Uncharacterized protein n=1 Tax=Arctia plantaginis TaxID=874455 RepID=A0A8S1A9Q1_ARCPL|nr:unnamed protein product [Arctia plantaginis]
MRAWLVVCAALALAPCRATAAAAAHAHRTHPPHPPHTQHPTDPQRLERIKSQILAKLGLSARPTPLGAPPRDVVRQILARAADPRPPPQHHDTDNEHAMREIIAIAHRGTQTDKQLTSLPTVDKFNNGFESHETETTHESSSFLALCLQRNVMLGFCSSMLKKTRPVNMD